MDIAIFLSICMCPSNPSLMRTDGIYNNPKIFPRGITSPKNLTSSSHPEITACSGFHDHRLTFSYNRMKSYQVYFFYLNLLSQYHSFEIYACHSMYYLYTYIYIYMYIHIYVYIISDQISHSVMSDSLRPYELQHARPPCPSPTPGVHSDSCPSSQ